MGGSKNPITNGPTSAILLCRPCHQWVESNRSLATDQGWLVPSRVDPGIVPIWRHGQWWLLEADRWQPANLNPPF
jgi:hypothetical protein